MTPWAEFYHWYITLEKLRCKEMMFLLKIRGWWQAELHLLLKMRSCPFHQITFNSKFPKHFKPQECVWIKRGFLSLIIRVSTWLLRNKIGVSKAKNSQKKNHIKKYITWSNMHPLSYLRSDWGEAVGEKHSASLLQVSISQTQMMHKSLLKEKKITQTSSVYLKILLQSYLMLLKISCLLTFHNWK